MKCPNCLNEESTKHPLYGVMVGKNCKKLRDNQKSPGNTVEFTTEDIKNQRTQYSDDIIQPYRSGELSKSYIKKYGTKGLDVTEAEVKKALNNDDVWSGENTYYKE